MRRALITGIAGQDGSYLAELLLSEGLEVHGTVRPGDGGPWWRLEHIRSRLSLHAVDLLDGRAVAALVQETCPHECYHLTGTRKAISDGATEADLLEGALGTTHALLAAVRRLGPQAALFHAASSEMFGPDSASPLDESAPLDPRSIYAIAKAAGLQLVRLYREEMGLRACSGILFNHESPRRGAEFVTRKISAGAARIKLGLETELRLGDLDARRDWGHARSFARGMRAMIRQASPEDLVLATGRPHTVGDFVQVAFGRLGLDWRAHVRVDPSIPRARRPGLVGNPARAMAHLQWQDDVPFRQLVEEMVDADLERAKRERSGRALGVDRGEANGG